MFLEHFPMPMSRIPKKPVNNFRNPRIFYNLTGSPINSDGKTTEDEIIDNIFDVLCDISEENGRVRIFEIGRFLSEDDCNTPENIALIKSKLIDYNIKITLS